MKILAIGDRFIPGKVMYSGLSELEKYGCEIEVREWEHPSLEELQADNLIIEQQGPEAVSVDDNLYKGIENFDMLIVQFAPIPKKVMDLGKKLKLIGVLRGGTENIDIKYAEEKNIAVLNTPGRNARAVAEFTLGMILSEVRNISRSHADLKKCIWRKDFINRDNIPELYNKNVGIVGFGKIGQLVATYLKAFGSNISVYDPYFQDEFEGVTFVDLEKLMKESDIVTVHARLTKDTYHMIDKKMIDLMKDTAYLVNTARSGLVDEKALIEALKEKKIAGAALDVFDKEPLEESDEILKLDNITITSHMAGSTKDAFTNSPKIMCDNVINLIEGKGKAPIINNVSIKLK
ncbi:2-hydroxyacid dehydrogenase [Clostridium sp. MSJ-4]|uniref:2-hydroxyacid dehydrogenase n=1 Tax=Clostridium simiarum TaxID=2841506 RepID=A0ABS6EVH2_9CLOT|nr:2-hydroxyacid dehydrogenase [Clostridium simiarum]MBU5590220.1 2-hydroxyacid dehydrogenase [Clostridium simiarum]